MASVLQEKNLFLIYSKNFFFFTWKFEEAHTKPGYSTRSSEFQLVEGETSFIEVEVIDNFNMYIYLRNPSISVKKGHFTILISDESNTILHGNTVSINNFLEEEDKGKGIDLLHSYPTRDLPSSVRYPLVITCISIDWNSEVESNVKSSMDFPLLNNLKELSLDFKKVLDQTIDSDIVLSVDGDNLKAHKMILQARSPVFHKMFTREAADNPIAISDIGSETMKRLLNFLYTGTMEKCGFEKTLELYYAADKYEVISLRDCCKTELLNCLQVNNACIVFALANRHSDETLKTEVVQFIRNNFKSVVAGESFDELNKDDMKLLMRLCV